jgi:hypothetical protein
MKPVLLFVLLALGTAGPPANTPEYAAQVFYTNVMGISGIPARAKLPRIEPLISRRLVALFHMEFLGDGHYGNHGFLSKGLEHGMKEN